MFSFSFFSRIFHSFAYIMIRVDDSILTQNSVYAIITFGSEEPVPKTAGIC